MNTIERFRGCLLGLAVGDAIGTTVEFCRRSTFEPLRDMVGGGPHELAPGQWTDDTSMALCLATSLVEREEFDVRDQMDRYCRWANTGYMSSTGRCFDIGNTVASALQRYQRDGEPYAGSTDPYTAGNGCIMRLAPVAMSFFPDLDAVERYAADSSRTTHGAEECIDACRFFARIICRALLGRPKTKFSWQMSTCFFRASVYRLSRARPTAQSLKRSFKDQAMWPRVWRQRCGPLRARKILQMQFSRLLTSAATRTPRPQCVASLPAHTTVNEELLRVGRSS